MAATAEGESDGPPWFQYHALFLSLSRHKHLTIASSTASISIFHNNQLDISPLIAMLLLLKKIIMLPDTLCDRVAFAIKVFIFSFQLYEIDDNPKRKEFLDDLFSTMQRKGKETSI